MRQFDPFLYRTYKPLLHKKGKQWIVIGLSALSLIGLGSAFNFTANADTTNKAVKNNINNNLRAVHVDYQPTQTQNNIQTHPESEADNTQNINQQANNLHNQIVNNNTSTSASFSNLYNDNLNSNSVASSSNAFNNDKDFNSSLSNSNSVSLNSADDENTSSISTNSVSSSNISVNKNRYRNNSIANTNLNKININKNNQVDNFKDNKIEKISTNKIGDSNIKKGTYDNFDYKFNPSTNSIEFTKGSIDNFTDEEINGIQYDPKLDQVVSPADIIGKIGTNTNLIPIYNVKIDSDVDTSQLTDASNMFIYQSAQGHFKYQDYLKTLELPSNFGQNISSTFQMFKDQPKLVSLTLPDNFGQNCQKIDAGSMFQSDTNLKNVTLSKSFGQKIHDATAMFQSDTNLTNLTLPTGFGQDITWANSMFQSDTNLTNLTLPIGFGQNITNAQSMFQSDSQLKSLLLPKYFGYKCSDMDYLFEGDISLQKLVLPIGFGKNMRDESGYGSGYNMFNSVANLQYLTIPSDFILPQKLPSARIIHNLSPQRFAHFKNELKVNRVRDMKRNSGFTLIPNSFIDVEHDIQGLNKSNITYSWGYTYPYLQHALPDLTQSDLTNIWNIPHQSVPLKWYKIPDYKKTDYIPNKDKTGLIEKAVNLTNGQPHPGTWISSTTPIPFPKNQNTSDTDKIEFKDNKGYTVGNTIFKSGKQGNQGIINQSDLPNGYSLVDPSKNTFTFGQFSDGSHVHVFAVKYTGSNNVPTKDTVVNIKSNIIIHLNGKNGTTKNIPITNIIQGKYNHPVNLLSDADGYNIATPNDFIGKLINGKGASYENSNGSYTYTPTASDVKYNDGSTNWINRNITLNFNDPNVDFSGNNSNIKNFNINNIRFNDQNGKNIPDSNVSANGNDAGYIHFNIPNGYHLPSDINYHFNSDGNLVDGNGNNVSKDENGNYDINLQGDKVTGTATIYRKYKQSNGHVDIQPKHVVLHGEVGDSTTIYPSDYDANGYEDNNQPWTINFTSSDVSNNDENGSSFNPTHEFDYNGQDLDIVVHYVNADNNNQSINNSKGTNSDDLGAYALENSTIDLKKQDTSDNVVNINGTNYNLNLPTGYHLKNNDNYLTVVPATNPDGSLKLNSQRHPYMLLSLGLTTTSKKNNGNNVKPNSNNNGNHNSDINMPNKPTNPITPNNNHPSNNIIPNINIPSTPSNNNNNSSNNNINIPGSNRNSDNSSKNNGTININVPNTPNNSSNKNNNIIITPTHHNHIKKVHSINALIHIKTGQAVRYKGVKVVNITNRRTPYYVYNIKNILLHNNIHNIGDTKKYAVKISKHRGFTGKILRKLKINNKPRFLVRWHHHDYFVTARKKFVRNAYIQPSEFKHHRKGIIKHATIKLRKNARIYNSIHFTGKHFKRNIKVGSKVNVIGIKNFGRRGYKRTRLVLSNGLIITANKNYVKFI